jgi:hypothetical protein
MLQPRLPRTCGQLGLEVGKPARALLVLRPGLIQLTGNLLLASRLPQPSSSRAQWRQRCVGARSHVLSHLLLQLVHSMKRCLGAGVPREHHAATRRGWPGPTA